MTRLSDLPTLGPTARVGPVVGEPLRPCGSPRAGGGQDLTLAQARAVVRGEFALDSLREACRVLCREGDWLDRERAQVLERLLDDPAMAPVKPAPALAPPSARPLFGARVSAGDALGAITLCALFVLGIWVAAGAGLPTGGDDLMGVVR